MWWWRDVWLLRFLVTEIRFQKSLRKKNCVCVNILLHRVAFQFGPCVDRTAAVAGVGVRQCHIVSVRHAVSGLHSLKLNRPGAGLCALRDKGSTARSTFLLPCLLIGLLVKYENWKGNKAAFRQRLFVVHDLSWWKKGRRRRRRSVEGSRGCVGFD